MESLALLIIVLAVGLIQLVAPFPTQSTGNCNPCKAGYYVAKDCVATLESDCSPCEEGTFSDESNHQYSCTPCSECPKGSNPLNPCTPTSDTECSPLDIATVTENTVLTDKNPAVQTTQSAGVTNDVIDAVPTMNDVTDTVTEMNDVTDTVTEMNDVTDAPPAGPVGEDFISLSTVESEWATTEKSVISNEEGTTIAPGSDDVTKQPTDAMESLEATTPGPIENPAALLADEIISSSASPDEIISTTPLPADAILTTTTKMATTKPADIEEILSVGEITTSIAETTTSETERIDTTEGALWLGEDMTETFSNATENTNLEYLTTQTQGIDVAQDEETTTNEMLSTTEDSVLSTTQQMTSFPVMPTNTVPGTTVEATTTNSTEEDNEPLIQALREIPPPKTTEYPEEITSPMPQQQNITSLDNSSSSNLTANGQQHGHIVSTTVTTPEPAQPTNNPTTYNWINGTNMTSSNQTEPRLQPVKYQQTKDPEYSTTSVVTPTPATNTTSNGANQTDIPVGALLNPVNRVSQKSNRSDDVKVNDSREDVNTTLPSTIKRDQVGEESLDNGKEEVDVINVTVAELMSTTTERIPTLEELEKEDEESDGSGEVHGDDDEEEEGKSHGHDDEGHHDKDPHSGASHHDSPEDKENKKRTAIIVGVTVGGLALFTLAFFTSRHCKKKREMRSKTHNNLEAIEFAPLTTSHPGIYDDMEARNPNGLYRHGPKMGPPSPRMHRKNEGKFEFPEAQRDEKRHSATLEVPKQAQASGSSHSLPEDDELDASPRDRLLPSNDQSPDASDASDKPKAEVVPDGEFPKPNGVGGREPVA